MARAKPSSQSSTPLGFEAKLWPADDKLRNKMDATEYEHVVLLKATQAGIVEPQLLI